MKYLFLFIIVLIVFLNGCLNDNSDNVKLQGGYDYDYTSTMHKINERTSVGNFDIVPLENGEQP
jgi:hypothetical protein